MSRLESIAFKTITGGQENKKKRSLNDKLSKTKIYMKIIPIYLFPKIHKYLVFYLFTDILIYEAFKKVYSITMNHDHGPKIWNQHYEHYELWVKYTSGQNLMGIPLHIFNRMWPHNIFLSNATSNTILPQHWVMILCVLIIREYHHLLTTRIYLKVST